MHGRIQIRLARMLAVAMCCGACTIAQAQGELPGNGSYVDTGYNGSSMLDNQTAASNTSMAANMNADQVDLSQRVADLEKALKKMDDKTKADKEAALNKPTVNVGGLIQVDTAMFGGENAKTQALPGPNNVGTDPFMDGTGFRRLRLQVSGDMWYNTDYKIEVDFNSTSRPSFKDVYFTIKELPWIQNVRIGHFKEPFGLEQQTSDRHGTFMERSMCDEGFIVPGRNIGTMFFGQSENERATFAMGVFLNQSGIENPPIFANNVAPGSTLTSPPLPTGVTTLDDQPQAALTTRATWTPWFDEATAGELNGSRGLWHVGGAYSYRSDMGYRTGTTGTIVSNYQIKPESYLAPVILDTTLLPAVSNQLVGVETALVYGSFSFQSEVFADYIEQHGGTNVTFTGAYAYWSYFLTGENRNYNRKTACFDRVKPFTNFFRVRTCDGDVANGWGAWEVGYRVTYVDMLDGLPNATTTSLASQVGLGRATDQTIGLNWYLNPYSKIMANYIFTTFDRIDDIGGTATLVNNHTVNTFEMRAQFDF
jgi:phosphate-selective porin OprO and OprP